MNREEKVFQGQDRDLWIREVSQRAEKGSQMQGRGPNGRKGGPGTGKQSQRIMEEAQGQAGP